jgi:hypothetical protein
MISASESPKVAARKLAAGVVAKGFNPEALHEYRTAEGRPIYWRIRAKRDDGEKWIRPMMVNGHGYELREPDFPNGKKPLYNLDRIAANADADVWVVEGEKAADVLTRLGAVATTSGSAKSASDADWTPVAGRRCILWPDNDEAGMGYAGDVGNVLAAMASPLSCVDVAKLNLPPKGDAWDWLQSHPNASRDDLQELPLLAYQPTVTNADFDRTPWPNAMDAAALHGITGEFVRMVEPNTEADPAAILVQFLVCFGALVGRGPHYRVEGDEHHGNLFALLVGATGKGRKGTSWSRVREVFERIPNWKRHASGLSSGEGLKFHVRDAREETKPNKAGELVTEVVDEGVKDKRLLVTEPEFASALRAMQRPGNTLSATIREGWDTGNLSTLTKHDPVTATKAHICIVGHITDDELRAELTATDSANGFANRFLFVAVQRSKCLPFGGDRADEGEIQAFALRLGELAERARTRQRMGLTADARLAWANTYPELSEGGGGLHGAVTARAEAQVVRLALIYALLDGAGVIDVPHLLAALAVWQYCNDTAKHIFGASLGDRAADEIMRRLRIAGGTGLTRTEIRDAFGRHKSAEEIGTALDLLRRKGRATCESVNTGGRPTEVWRTAK